MSRVFTSAMSRVLTSALSGAHLPARPAAAVPSGLLALSGFAIRGGGLYGGIGGLELDGAAAVAETGVARRLRPLIRGKNAGASG